MKDWGEILIQFGVSGAALAVLALHLWIHGRREKSSADRWEAESAKRTEQIQDLKAVLMANTHAIDRNTEALAIVRDRI